MALWIAQVATCASRGALWIAQVATSANRGALWTAQVATSARRGAFQYMENTIQYEVLKSFEY